MAVEISIPRPTSTNDTLVGFVDSPDGRGTLSILFTCLLTLSLCVWSAIHLDLPKPGESSTQYTVRYFKWSIVGLFAPEILIWVAWRQYLSARVLTQSVNETAQTEKTYTAAREWTIVHSFYVGMGGFVFDLTDSDLNGEPFIPGFDRFHVTPRGVQLLARCGLLPIVNKQDILDKSKTDGTAKLICCVQIIWTIASAVTRLAVKLPVTPLEVNTLAHVACALMIYTLWWYKPRWVNEPTILRGEWVRPLLAFMYMSSQVSCPVRRKQDLLRNFGVKTELAGVMYRCERTPSPQASSGSGLGVDAAADTDPATEAQLSSGHETPSHEGQVKGKIVSRAEGDVVIAVDKDQAHVAADAMEQTRWKHCCEAIEQYPFIKQMMKVPEQNAEHLRYREALQRYPEMPPTIQLHFKGRSLEDLPATMNQSQDWVFMSEELVIDRPRNWPGDDQIRHMQGHLMGMVMWCATTVYGAIHMAGWNEKFPTVVESWFWRASSSYIIFSGLLWSFLNFLGHVASPVWLYWYDFLDGNVRKWSRNLIYLLAFIGGTLYFVARTYVVVEAFISLRALPASAYASPDWILTVPHIG